MARDVMASIKTGNIIFSNGEDVLVAEKSIWLFRANGEYVKKLVAIRRPHKAAFLPNRTAIVDSGMDHAYYYLDLKTGDILWKTKKKCHRNWEASHFAVTPDWSTVYNLFYAWSGSTYCLHVERIIPEKQIHDIFPVKEPLNLTGELCITSDLFCDEAGTLCALQDKNITRYEEYDYMETPQVVFHYGILALPFQNEALAPYWKRDWKEKNGKWPSICACNGRYILYKDLSVLDMESGHTFFLLDDVVRKLLPDDYFQCFCDFSRCLLTLWYTGAKQNAVIDYKNRTLVGLYLRDEPLGVGYGGCLIGNEFWTGTSNGIKRKPFPNIDLPVELPPPSKAQISATSKFYAEHPELW